MINNILLKPFIILFIIFITKECFVQKVYSQAPPFSFENNENKYTQQCVSPQIKGSNTPDNSYLEAQLKRFNMSERIFRLKPALVVKTLKIKQDMHILDIGAGNGFFTFRFAEALKNSGHVFATEISQGLIGQLNTVIAEKNYQNVTPILVQKKGLDPFYKSRSFDIIFLGNVFYHLWHHEEYFRELAPSLKKGGRLFILQPKQNYNFDKMKLHNLDELMTLLKEKDEEVSIVYERFSKDVKSVFKKWLIGDPVSDKFQDLLIKDLNQMLSDKRLLDDVLEYYYETLDNAPWLSLYRRNEKSFHLLVWLKSDLDEKGLFDKLNTKTTDVMDEQKLHRINSIIICSILNIKIFDYLIYVQKINKIISIMDKAGYRFIKNYDFLEKQYFLEFIKK